MKLFGPKKFKIEAESRIGWWVGWWVCGDWAHYHDGKGLICKSEFRVEEFEHASALDMRRRRICESCSQIYRRRRSYYQAKERVLKRMSGAI